MPTFIIYSFVWKIKINFSVNQLSVSGLKFGKLDIYGEVKKIIYTTTLNDF